MKINEISYEGDCECDSELCVDVFLDIGISIFERNIKIICEHNTSMYYDLEPDNKLSINKNKQKHLDNDFFHTDLSNDIFEDIGMYLMERNMTINSENNYKQMMNNVLNELKQLFIKRDINNFENNDKPNILNKINSFGSISNFYISGEDPDISSDDFNSTKYSDTDEILFPGLNEM
jgi:hypothetical protein